jgi:hypothetical protein
LNLRTTSRCTKCQKLLRLVDFDFRRLRLKFRSWRWHREWFKRRRASWVSLAIFLLTVGIVAWLLTTALSPSGPRP